MSLARVSCAAALAALGLAASALPARAAPHHGKVTFEHACAGAGRHCHLRVAMQDGHYAALPLPLPAPLGEIAAHSPDELEAMYHVDITRGAGTTVAVIDAFGYPKLEADLAAYRAEFHLPACTKASGCLRIVNTNGDPDQLPAAGNTPDDKGWELETALDVDMVSAGCPLCKILVVQTDGPDDELDSANATAARLGANAISNSWSGGEGGDASTEPSFEQPGVGIFASSGDDGYAAGPQYPATSPHVIAVGGTRVRDFIVSHTATETAWADAGSSCSTEFAAPAFQPITAACSKRAASDVSAVADPATGVAIYSSLAGGMTSVGGTSASSPLVTAIFAASGHWDATPEFVYRHADAFMDVSGGSNGSCGTTMCIAGSGWDGPTGLGSPDQDALAAIGLGFGPGVTITAPADGTVETGAFTVEATAGSGAAHVDLVIDGTRIGGLAGSTGPYAFSAPALATPGAHVIVVNAYDADHDTATAQVTVVVPEPPPQAAGDAGASTTSPDGGDLPTFSAGGGGCGATGHGGGAVVLLGASVAAMRSRRRARGLRLP